MIQVDRTWINENGKNNLELLSQLYSDGLHLKVLAFLIGRRYLYFPKKTEIALVSLNIWLESNKVKIFIGLSSKSLAISIKRTHTNILQ